MKKQIQFLAVCLLTCCLGTACSSRRAKTQKQQIEGAWKTEVLLNADLFVGVIDALEAEDLQKVREIALVNLTFFEKKARVLVDSNLMSADDADEIIREVERAVQVADPEGTFRKGREEKRMGPREERRIVLPPSSP